MRDFDEAPTNEDGTSLLVASTEEEYRLYLEWLADYLYRPHTGMGLPLSAEHAATAVIAIEADIAFAIWQHPFDDYPSATRIPSNGARHADIPHRQALSRVLSRVLDHAERVRLLDRFYRELDRDMHK